MHYLFDYDSRVIEFQHEKRYHLETYINKNKLDLAMQILSNSKEILEHLSIKEMTDAYINITLNEPKESDPKILAEILWQEITFEKFQEFTQAKGKYSIRKHSKGLSDKLKSPSNKTKSNISKKRKSSNQTKPRILIIASEPKPNTVLHKLWNIVNENNGEMDFNEFIEAYLFENTVTETSVKWYINKAVKLNHLILKNKE